MITNALLGVATFIIGLVIAIFPNSTGVPTEITDAVETFGGYITIIDAIVPMDTLGYIVGLVISFELLVFSFRGLRYIVKHIPFVGGK